MESVNFEIFILMMSILGIGSSIIHYSAFAKSKIAVENSKQERFLKKN